MRAEIHLVAYLRDATWPDALPAEQVRLIADLGCALVVDLYVVGDAEGS
jgi:hypothetical protein